jgi:hypothetical protein
MRLTVELEDETGVGRPLVIDVYDDGTVGAAATRLRMHDVKSPSLNVLGGSEHADGDHAGAKQGPVPLVKYFAIANNRSRPRFGCQKKRKQT